MLTRSGCLKAGLMQKQLVQMKIVHIQNSHQCERLSLEYMQTRVYYNIHTDTWTRTRVNVNAALVLYVVSNTGTNILLM